MVLHFPARAGTAARLSNSTRDSKSNVGNVSSAANIARPASTGIDFRVKRAYPDHVMGTSRPDTVRRRDMTEMPAISDRVPSPADRKVSPSGDYKEEQLRLEFLNPFFTALGWDVTNKVGLTEVFKSVIHEESIKVAGASKAPDYSFSIGGRRVLSRPRTLRSTSSRTQAPRSSFAAMPRSPTG